MSNVRVGRRSVALLGVVATLGILSGCGGSDGDDGEQGAPAIAEFRADAANYFVGESARLTATFTNGSGRIDPGNLPISSGQQITTPPLSLSTEYTLTVTGGGTSVTRKLALNVAYRERMRTITVPFARAEHAAVTLNDGRVLILGGDGNESTLSYAMHVFDPRTEQFAGFGQLSTGRLGFTATLLNNGDVLVAGGMRALTGSPRAEIVNGRTGGATPTASDPQRDRYRGAATRLSDGRILLTGGLVAGDPDNSAEIYDPATGHFALVAGTFAYPRFDHVAVRIDDRKILLYGGIAYPGYAVPAPELFDPIAGTSTPVTAVEQHMRYGMAAMTATDGSVFIFGGEDEDANPLTSVVKFDPATSTLSRALDLATARTSADVARLTDGRLLITGGGTGAYGTDVSATSEIVGLPAQRRDGPTMSTSRFMHTVTRLSNGKVLIMGGLDASKRALATAEIFE